MRKVSVVLPILFNKNETQTMLAKKNCAISSDLYMVMVTFSEDYGDLCSYFEDMELNHEKSKESRNKRNLLDSLLFDDHSKVTQKIEYHLWLIISNILAAWPLNLRFRFAGMC